ncbi:MAG: histidine phosphatase family protein [Candidatus Sericytochromatia bacterium]|nr:histidine phosphatase family protein [Candidatus Sericytochromatia bacterium]
MSLLDHPLPLNGACLLLIRHGQTPYNAEGRAQGWLDIPLSPLGYLQAEATAERLAEQQIDALYSSPLNRAYATALAIGRPHGLVPRAMPGLREVHTGALTGRTWPEAEALFPEAIAAYRTAEAANPHPRHREYIPGWEPIAAFLGRIWEATQAIVDAHPGQRAAVVCHGGVLNALLTHVMSGLQGTETPWSYRHDNVAVSELRLTAPTPTLVAFNQLLHAVQGPGEVIF